MTGTASGECKMDCSGGNYINCPGEGSDDVNQGENLDPNSNQLPTQAQNIDVGSGSVVPTLSVAVGIVSAAAIVSNCMF